MNNRRVDFKYALIKKFGTLLEAARKTEISYFRISRILSGLATPTKEENQIFSKYLEIPENKVIAMLGSRTPGRAIKEGK